MDSPGYLEAIARGIVRINGPFFFPFAPFSWEFHIHSRVGLRPLTLEAITTNIKFGRQDRGGSTAHPVEGRGPPGVDGAAGLSRPESFSRRRRSMPYALESEEIPINTHDTPLQALCPLPSATLPLSVQDIESSEACHVTNLRIGGRTESRSLRSYFSD